MQDNQNIKIIKFLSIIFNPNNYPMSIGKIQNIAQGLFCDNALVENILNEFELSDRKYYIKENSYFSPPKIIGIIKHTIQSWNKSEYLNILCLNYNTSKDYELFNKLLKRNKAIFRTIKIKKYLKDLIINLKKKKYLAENSNLDLKAINNLNNFHDIELNFYNHRYLYECNSCLNNFILRVKLLEIYSWKQLIDYFPHKLLKLIFNSDDYFFVISNPKFYIKQLNTKSSKDVISFAFLNIFQYINKKNSNIKFLFNALDKLSYKNRFYYFGLLVANSEYALNKDLYNDFEHRAEKYLIKIIPKIMTNKKYLNVLKLGLKNTSRNCHFKILTSVIVKYKKTNSKLAKLLAKELLLNYEEKIYSNNNYELVVYTNKECKYVDAIIAAIIYLFEQNQINIYKLFKKWNKSFNINQETFSYSYSSNIELKNKVFNVFVVELLVFEILINNKYKIKYTYLKDLIETYIKWINMFYNHLDIMENYSIYNIFKLKILKSYVKNEISYLCELSEPNFTFIAMLISLSNDNNSEYKLLIDEYFNKYNEYWDNYKIKEWLNIWVLLKNIGKINQCLDKFPKWEKEELINQIKISSTNNFEK